MSRSGAPAAGTPEYDAQFYSALEAGVARSAAVAAPLLCALFDPASVVDVGCGTGLWLAALRERGVSEVLGVDGPWVPRDRLAIPETMFLARDLTAPLVLDRRFDLALCLETAEHLPADAAEALVDSLVRLAPAVAFSAAVPGQGGHGHLNEQWPSYWARLFAARGYRGSTLLRNRLWGCAAIEPWYRQNLLLFVDAAHASPPGGGLPDDGDSSPFDIVHPDVLRYVRDQAKAGAAEVERLARDIQALEKQLNRRRRVLRAARSRRGRSPGGAGCGV